MLILQQKQICKYAWKQVINIQQTRFFLIKQSNQQVHQKLNHQAKVPAVVILIEANVQKIILLSQVVAKAKAAQQRKLSERTPLEKIKTKADGFVCNHLWV